ncbi:hypothetical protein IWQ62_000332 [Dispira parvispora]|uniref:Threonylcarbamoyl-AMP synthase n=1 Tax=Dispira parvispora TaxID=1520584 RepID=A0A9W8AX87_9FUNG|nr:hypothetical protein IWQ62_000332 [Dispira parvispora]
MTHSPHQPTNVIGVDPTSLSFGQPDAIDQAQLFIHHQALPCPDPTYPVRDLSDTPHPATVTGNNAHQVPKWLQEASRLLHSNQAVALPTETVYGLAANALCPEAVEKIYRLKNRPADNPLIIHVASLAMLRALLPDRRIPTVYKDLIARYWPGPLTLLMPRSALIPDVVTCGQATVAVRFPAHPVARAVIAYTGLPLAAPSANSSGKPSPTLAQHVWDDLRERVPLILDAGQCEWGIESTVVDGLRVSPAILRPGGVTLEQIQKVVGFRDCQVYRKNFTDSRLEQTPTTPGMKYRHYSPNAQVVLLERRTLSDDVHPLTNEQEEADYESSHKEFLQAAQNEMERLALTATPQGLTFGLLSVHPDRSLITTPIVPAHCQLHVRSMTDWSKDPTHSDQPCSRHLFKSFREFDQLGVHYILVEGTSEAHEGLALMNRLRKAATRTVYY